MAQGLLGYWAAGLLVCVVAACASAPARPPGSPVWAAELTPAAGSRAGGKFEIQRAANPYETRFALSLQNLPADVTARWRLYAGSCAKREGTTMSSSQIPDVRANAVGSATTELVVAMKPPEAGKYAVVVTALPDHRPVGCFDLQRIGRVGT